MTPLEQGEPAVMKALKLQGQIKGIDLAIDAIFEIANYEAEESTDARPDEYEPAA